jgi:hypothetical protein
VIKGNVDNCDECRRYIEMQYLRRSQTDSRKIYSHVTCATDTEQVSKVVNSVIDTVIGANLKGMGL